MAGSKKMAEMSLMELKEAVTQRGLDKTGDRIILMNKLRKALIDEGKDPNGPIPLSGINSSSNGTKKTTQESTGDLSQSSDAAKLNEETNGGTAEDEEMVVKRDWKGHADNRKAPMPDRRVLWISGLVHTYLSADLKKLLSEFGTVVAVKIVASTKDPDAKLRFGQVTMSTPTEAAICIEKLNNRLLFGQRITVQLKFQRDLKKALAASRERSASPTPPVLTVWVKNLPPTTKAADLKALFIQHVTVAGAKVVATSKEPGAKRFGLVTLATSAEVERCIEVLNGTSFNGHTITVEKKVEKKRESANVEAEPSVPVLTVWVKDLPPTTKAADLKALFIQHATVTGAKVVAKSKDPGAKRFGLVTLSSPEEVQKCIEALNGAPFNGNTITVEKGKGGSKSKSETAVTPKKAAHEPVERARTTLQRPAVRGSSVSSKVRGIPFVSSRGPGRGLAFVSSRIRGSIRGSSTLMRGGRGGPAGGRGLGSAGRGMGLEGRYRRDISAKVVFEEIVKERRALEEDMNRARQKREAQMRMTREMQEEEEAYDRRDREIERGNREWQPGPPMRHVGGMIERGGYRETEMEEDREGYSETQWGERGDYSMGEQDHYGQPMYTEEMAFDGSGYTTEDGYEDPRGRGDYMGHSVPTGRGGFRGQAPTRGAARGVTRGIPRGGGGLPGRDRGFGSEYSAIQGQGRAIRGQGHLAGMGRGQSEQGSWDQGQTNHSTDWASKFNDKSEWRPFPASNQTATRQQQQQSTAYDFNRYSSELGRSNQFGGRQESSYASPTNQGGSYQAQGSSYQISPNAGISGRNGTGSGPPAQRGAPGQRGHVTRGPYGTTSERSYGTPGGYEQGSGTLGRRVPGRGGILKQAYSSQWVSGGSQVTGENTSYEMVEPTEAYEIQDYQSFDDSNTVNYQAASYDAYGNPTGANNSNTSYNWGY